MVDIATPLWNANETTQTPQSHVGSDAFHVAPRHDISQGLSALGDGLETEATQLALKQASEDVRNGTAGQTVGRSPDGSPQIVPTPSSFIMGPAGIAYQRAAEAGSLAKGEVAVNRHMVDMNAQFDGKPQEFLKASDALSNQLRAQYPGKLGEALAQHAATLGSQYYAGQTATQTRQAVSNDQAAIIARVSDAKNEALNLANQNGTDTPEFNKALGVIQGGYGELTANPAFGMPKEKADIELKNFQDYAQASAVSAQVDRVFNKGGVDGGRAGAQKVLTEQILNMPGSLSQETRQHLYSVGMARLQYLTEGQKASVDAIKPTVEAWFDGLNSGKLKPDDPMFDATLEKVQATGYSEGAQKMNGARWEALRRAGTQGLSNGQMVRWMEGGAGLPALQSAFFGQESGSGKNPATSVDGARGGMQVMPNTFILYAKAGENIDNPADNRAVGNRIVADLYNRYHGDAQRVAVGYFSGEGNIAPAGSPTPWKRDTRDGNGKYVSSYVSDMNARLSGQPLPKSSNGVPYTREQINANPFLLTAYVQAASRDNDAAVATAKSVGAAIVQGLKADQLPPPETMAWYKQISDQHPKELGDQAGTILAHVQGNDVAMHAAQLPGENGQSYMDHVMTLSQGASLHDQLVARTAQEAYQRRVTNLKNDPWDEAAQRGWGQRPSPLDFGNADNLAQGLKQRATLAQAIGSRENNPDQPLFSPDEMKQVQAIAANGTVDQKLALFDAAAKSGATDRSYNATIAQLATGGAEAQTMAMAGVVARDNPDAARGILIGQSLLKQNERLGPASKDREAAAMRSIPVNDFPFTADRDRMVSATTAYYAKLSAEANDTSQGFNQNRWDQSVNAVTGGVVNFRGSNVLAPWYGAPETQFRASVQSLTDADMRGAITADGSPFPAAALQSRNLMTSGNWRLQSVGDGKYMIFSGDDTNRRYVMTDRLDAHDPKPGAFVLDLSAKKMQVQNTPAPNGFLAPPTMANIQKPGWPSPAIKPVLPVSSEMGQ